ncbi:unnamed protein product [Didymodactylos carnosus]|uniref:ADP-ribosylglycohydrolase n=1 Tax=Didymodactylos carnosus TaxID=1234261 RepID=A0A814YYL8_9BILA|nr:unnamed protein product [Didymodactylos carnosus]CAF1236426.1 unnamed protein product [Didymodactylos carnosus]CAF3580635.1 unnamed protein product [Didymodactylos carnosus]CAF3998760.1 unnamed protein product [Didymodactylos carnosus]
MTADFLLALRDGELPHKIKWQTPPKEKDDHTYADKFRGSLLGLAVGDALGAHVEFRPHSYLQQNPVTGLAGGGTWSLEAGKWTDDTSMALCLAVSLIVHGGFYAYDQLVRYKWWYKSGYLSSTGRCFDIGSATKTSLETFHQRQRALANKLNINSEEKIDTLEEHVIVKEEFNTNCSYSGVAGNGALMRLAPIPLFFWRSNTKATQFAAKSALLTHGDKKAADACRYYALLICCAINGYSKEQLLNTHLHVDAWDAGWFGQERLHEEVIRVAEGSYQRSDGFEGGIKGKGYIISAMEAALWAFWSDEDKFENGVLRAINLGDDTDTTAAIYGQLAGACYGAKAIPRKWLDKLYAKDLITCLADWLKYKGSTSDSDGVKNQQATFPKKSTLCSLL